MLSIIGIGLSHLKKKKKSAMKLFNKLRQKIPFSDMIYFTYVCPIQRSVLKEYQFLEAEIFFSFWMAPYSVVYGLVLSWVIGLTQWRARNNYTGFIPWFNLISLRQRLWF